MATAEQSTRREPEAQTGTSVTASMRRALYVASDDLEWVEGPASMPPGTKMALLDGDPSSPDRLYTMRLKLPAGAQLQPHWHPGADEHVTVISGEIRSGEGDTFAPETARVLTAGSFYAFPAGHAHFAVVTKECVIQMHGVGPWQVVYVRASSS